MLTIYGSKMSGSCAKVEWTAKLLKIPHTFKELDTQKDLQTPEYLARNPVGKIPAIDDDGFSMFESGAIIRYLCDKNNSEYYPKDLKKRALVDQWIDFCTHHVASGLGKIAHQKVFAPMRGSPVDQADLDRGYKEVDRFMPPVEAQLKKHKFLAGDKMTIADVVLLGTLFYADKSQVDLSKYPHLVNWRKVIMGMDFVK